jgi:hypothetical protein
MLHKIEAPAKGHLQIIQINKSIKGVKLQLPIRKYNIIRDLRQNIAQVAVQEYFKTVHFVLNVVPKLIDLS